MSSIVNKESTKPREHYVDLGKGILICMVVMIHLVSMLPDSIEVFVVPCFFTLSGMFYNEKIKSLNWCVKKVKTILYPYIIWGLPAIMYTIFWWSCHVDTEYGVVVSESSVHNHPLWYLESLFVVSIVFKLLFQLLKKEILVYAVCIGMGILTFVLRDYTTFKLDTGVLQLAYNVNIAFLFWPVYMPFYALGYIMKKYDFYDYKRYGMYILVIATLVWMSWMSDVDASVWLGNVGVYFVWVFLLIFAFIYLIRRLDSNPLLELIGRNSLLILCIHEYLYFVVRKFDFFDKVLQFLIIVIACLLIAKIVNKFAPWLLALKLNKC